MSDEKAIEFTPEELAKMQASYTRRMRFYRLCWVLWIFGAILIVLNWGNIVSPTIGWIGFGVAMTGTVLSFLTHLPSGKRDLFS
ncbi:MAG: hypothetical protein JSS27_02750 [Planctomycetes bacterium]|nr:hypothetical protein [Planctomycetota bacterium]